jgi:hypothetical protein
MCELGAALCRLLRLGVRLDPAEWRCNGDEFVARRQLMVGKLLARATERRCVPMLSPKLWERIRGLR